MSLTIGALFHGYGGLELGLAEVLARKWKSQTVDADLPTNWKGSVRNYLAAGLDRDDLSDAIDATRNLSPFSPWKFFPYFCGVCRNKAAAIREAAETILSEEVAPDA